MSTIQPTDSALETDLYERLDPSARAFAAAFPVFDTETQNLEDYRRIVTATYQKAGDASVPDRREIFVPGAVGHPDVRILVYRPPMQVALAPAIIHLHGGGFFSGTADMIASESRALARDHDAVVIAVDYRLAPETPFPGPLEDCYAALGWTFREASALGINPDRVVVMGGSAGGGLAAALAQLARDRAEWGLRAQVLIYPMLDARTGTSEAPVDNAMTGQLVWTRPVNQFGWSAMRGQQAIPPDQLGHFSPSLAKDFSNLPEAFIAVGSLDLLLEESVAYGLELARAAVPVEAHIFPRAPHGFRSIPGPLGDGLKDNIRKALDRFFTT